MYLAKPETASSGGVLVLHSWWGLNDFHWFFESDRSDAFVPEAADLAWHRTLSFLREQRSV